MTVVFQPENFNPLYSSMQDQYGNLFQVPNEERQEWNELATRQQIISFYNSDYGSQFCSDKLYIQALSDSCVADGITQEQIDLGVKSVEDFLAKLPDLLKNGQEDVLTINGA